MKFLPAVLSKKIVDFMWGKPKIGEGKLSSSIKFCTMVYMRCLLALLGYGLGERTVEYKWVLDNLSKGKARRLLDIGCGYTRLDCLLRFLGYDVYAIDVNRPPYLHPEIKFIQDDITRANLKTDFFDTAISISTLEHVGFGKYGDPQMRDGDVKALQNIKRVLKKSGLFLITGPFANESYVTWLRFYTPSRIDRLKKGFSVVKEDYFVKLGRRWVKVTRQMATTLSDSGSLWTRTGGPNALFCLKLQKKGSDSMKDVSDRVWAGWIMS